MPTCSVIGCLNRHEKKSGFSFYSFPFKQALVLKKWIRFCNRGETWLAKKSHTVCGRHFEEQYFQDRPDIRRLKDGAIPTLEHPISGMDL